MKIGRDFLDIQCSNLFSSNPDPTEDLGNIGPTSTYYNENSILLLSGPDPGW